MAVMNDVVSRARALLQDATLPFRYSTTDLVASVNDALDVMVAVKPELFMGLGNHICAAGPEQQLSPTVWFGLVRVIGITNGQALQEIDWRTLDAFDPQWRRGAQGVPVEYAKLPGDKTRFLVNPPAAGGLLLDVQGVLMPPEYGPNDQLSDLLTPYVGHLVDFAVGVAEAREDEAAAGAKVQQFITLFIQKLAGLSPAEAGAKRQ